MKLRQAFYPLIILLVMAVISFVTVPLSAQEQKPQKKSSNSTGSYDANLDLAIQYANEILKTKRPAKTARPQKRNPWAIFGSFGYAFNDNVPLASDQKPFRPGHVSTNAGQYHINGGVSFDFYQSETRRAGFSFVFDQFLHDNGLNQFNFQNYEVNAYYEQRMRAWDRPATFSASYSFDYGLQDQHTFSSSNFWKLAWVGEWRENFLISVYERLGGINFRNKGFQSSISSRDGFYQQTGLVHTFLFDQRRRSLSIGYEFALAATEGANFDMIGNGAQVRLKTPVIEKIFFEAMFFFQSAYYQHFKNDPKRNDMRYLFEFRLSRPIFKHWLMSAFYQRTDVNDLHEGVLGQFSYERNIYGTELSFYYS